MPHGIGKEDILLPAGRESPSRHLRLCERLGSGADTGPQQRCSGRPRREFSSPRAAKEYGAL